MIHKPAAFLNLIQALVHAFRQAQETEFLTERELEVLRLMVDGLNNGDDRNAEEAGVTLGNLST